MPFRPWGFCGELRRRPGLVGILWGEDTQSTRFPGHGVTLGLAYLQRYSSHVRTAVLDSGSLLSVPLYQQGAVHDQQAFDQIASPCAAPPPAHGPTTPPPTWAPL